MVTINLRVRSDTVTRLFQLAVLFAILPLTALSGPCTIRDIQQYVVYDDQWVVDVPQFGISGVTPYYAYDPAVNVWGIGLTSNLNGAGTPIPGLDLDTWNGVWIGTHKFNYPAPLVIPGYELASSKQTIQFWADPAHLPQYVDDKAYIKINGWSMGAFAFGYARGIERRDPVEGSGTFNFGAGEVHLNEQGPPGHGEWYWDIHKLTLVCSVPNDVWNECLWHHTGYGETPYLNPLILGGMNEIQVYVNNTNSFDLWDGARTLQGEGDFTYFRLWVDITTESWYRQTPEPSTLSLFCGGLLVVAGVRLRSRRGRP